MMKNSRKTIIKWLEKYWLLLFFALLGFGVVFVPYSSFNGLTWNGHKLHVHDYNELGDFIGGITTPILSFLGIVLLYLTYKSQKKELKETKRALRSQQASSVLFSMINVLDNMANNLRFKEPELEVSDEKSSEIIPEMTYTGRDVLEYRFEHIKSHTLFGSVRFIYKPKTDNFWEHYRNGSKAPLYPTDTVLTVDEYVERLEPHLTSFFLNESQQFCHYLNYIESIIDFIDHSFTDREEKDFYFRTFSSQLSSYESGLIFYYSLSTLKPRLMDKLVRAHFLQHLEYRSLHDGEQLHIYLSKLLAYKRKVVPEPL